MTAKNLLQKVNDQCKLKTNEIIWRSFNLLKKHHISSVYKKVSHFELEDCNCNFCQFIFKNRDKLVDLTINLKRLIKKYHNFEDCGNKMFSDEMVSEIYYLMRQKEEFDCKRFNLIDQL